MSNEQGVRLKVHTLFSGGVLYFPISHSSCSSTAVYVSYIICDLIVAKIQTVFIFRAILEYTALVQ